MSNYLDNLNKEQKKAATHIDGPLLILAGAGTGKTQTMISRLVYLISEVGISPSSILSLTFTNKAASSMQSRAIYMLNQVGFNDKLPTLSTFHSFGMQFISENIDILNGIRKANFRIIDTDDKKEIIKAIILDELKKEDKNFLVKSDKKSSDILNEEKNYLKELCKKALNYIDYSKNTISFDEENECYKYYLKYEEELRFRNLIDFDDLIILPYLMLSNNPIFAKKISEQYTYIMVDEYQDTNLAQLKLLKALCTSHNNIVVVGDDDQSIYSFRYARVENILNFAQDFQGAKIIKLEQNYRSTKNILNAANKLISYNENRYGKTLFTENDQGAELIGLNNYYEVTQEIKKLVDDGVKYNDICIIYRMNVSANKIEPKLITMQLPYKVIGSVPFYSRAEIKLLINYLKLYVDKNDNYAFKKIINSPRRGFGDKALEKLEDLANGSSLYECLKNNISQYKKAEINDFISLFENSKERFALFYEKLKALNVSSSLSEPEERQANCNIFFNMLSQECGFNIDEQKLIDFLNKITLQEQMESKTNDSINLMSIHASKGLEYDYVFLIDCDYGQMPSIHGEINQEEERRLAYVAITRAKKKFYYQYDYENPSIYVSQFKCIETDFKPKDKQVAFSYEKPSGFKKNDCVKHKIFGIGYVMLVEGDLITAKFAGNVKKLKANFLELITN